MTYHRGTLEEFNVWHDAVKILEEITSEGKIGFVNGVAAPDNQRTVAYSLKIAHPINDNDYIWSYGSYVSGKDSLSLSDVKLAGWFPKEI